MVTTDTNKKRNVFLTANKYQDKIVLLSFLPSAFIFLAFMGIVFVGNPIVAKAIYHSSYPQMIKMVLVFTGALVFCICLIVLLSMMMSFVISHHIVGPFGRIIKELDDVLAGKASKLITSRPGDDLAAEILKRINILVEFYVKNKTQFNKD